MASARRFLVLSVLVLALAVPATSAQAAGGLDLMFIRATNQFRGTHGVRSLRSDATLARLAYLHSVSMARQNRLYHNDISHSVRGWVRLGQNVGYGPSVAAIQQAFIHSPGHRANILNGRYNKVGIGTFVRGRTIWVTVNFEQTAADAFRSRRAVARAGEADLRRRLSAEGRGRPAAA